MIIIALVLFANIFVLRIYFKEGTPPTWIEKLCDFLSIKKSKRVQRVHVSQAADGAHPVVVVKSTATVTGIKMTESNGGSPALVERVEELEFTWRRVARKLDQVFLVLFVIASCIAYAVTFS